MFVRRIPGVYKGTNPIIITGVGKIHLKANFIEGFIVNGGVREPILYSIALDKQLGHKKYKEPRIKRFKKINKSALSHITIYSEDADYKPVDFNG